MQRGAVSSLQGLGGRLISTTEHTTVHLPYHHHQHGHQVGAITERLRGESLTVFPGI